MVSARTGPAQKFQSNVRSPTGRRVAVSSITEKNIVKTLQLGFITLSTVILVSCGGGSSAPTTPTPTPTAPTPTPPATSISATVSIPVGAASLGSRAYVASPVTIAPGGTVR